MFYAELAMGFFLPFLNGKVEYTTLDTWKEKNINLNPKSLDLPGPTWQQS